MTPDEIRKLGWKRPDVILVTGAAYIDSPSIGVSVVGHALTAAGFKVAVIAQPDLKSESDITRLGEPELFWGVTGGSVDSMVANYTATGKPRRSDDYTPGGVNDRRPDRAVIAYSNLIRRYFKQTAPIVLGGVEASLRRIAHYDFWSDSVRRSVLFDAKADVLVYGMAERAIVELARRFEEGADWRDIPGICYASKEPPGDYIELPSYEQTAADGDKFNEAFRIFYENLNPYKAKGVVQLQDTRWLVQNPPDNPVSPAELDAVYELPYEHAAHPSYSGKGKIRARHHRLFDHDPPGLCGRVPVLRDPSAPGTVRRLSFGGVDRSRSDTVRRHETLQGRYPRRRRADCQYVRSRLRETPRTELPHEELYVPENLQKPQSRPQTARRASR
jgi:uncharacterized radical SAM protein YgiQ